MRNYTRWRKQEPEQRPRLHLVRGADGRLRPAGDEAGAAVEARQRPAASRPLPKTDMQDKQVVSQAKPKRTFRLPHLPLPTIRLKRPSKRHGYVAVVAVVVVLLGVGGYSLMNGRGGQPARPAPKVLDLKATKGPDFDALLPKGKDIQDLGGWARVSPADKDPVFAYVDMVAGIQLNISQQQLPAALRTNAAEQVERLAEAYAANEKIAINTGTAYLGTSIHGPQSLIFTRNGLLVLIKSSGKLTTQQWADYVSSLQ